MLPLARLEGEPKSGAICVDLFISTALNRLCGKIEADPADPVYILTVWGVGYKFADDE